MRLDSLTGLRFWAALLVFAFHADAHFALGFRPAQIGYTGVAFFFVLSGFVLTWSRKPDTSTWRFYWHRFARVWPLHALVTAAVVAITATSSDALIANLTFIPGLIVGHASPGFAIINGPSWSLSVEVVLYALFPLLIARLTTTRLRPVLLVAFLAPATFAFISPGWTGTADEFWTYQFVLMHVGEFVFGITAALAVRRGWSPSLPLAVIAVCAAYGVLAGMQLAFWVTNLLLAPVFALLLAAAASAEMQGGAKWLRERLLVALGCWSFAFYLVHFQVMFQVHAAGWPGAALAFGIAVAMAGVLYRCFERPMERWLRGLLVRSSPHRLEQAPTPTPTPSARSRASPDAGSSPTSRGLKSPAR